MTLNGAGFSMRPLFGMDRWMVGWSVVAAKSSLHGKAYLRSHQVAGQSERWLVTKKAIACVFM